MSYINKIQVDGVEYDLEAPQIYDDQERVIGTWIDGKPIYRIVFSGLFSNDDILLENVDNLIDLKGNVIISNVKRALPYFEFHNNQKYCGRVDLNSSNQVTATLFQGGQSVSNNPCMFIIEYTKTTDNQE